MPDLYDFPDARSERRMIAGLATHAIVHRDDGHEDEIYDGPQRMTEALERLCHPVTSHITLTLTGADGNTETLSFGLSDIDSSVHLNFTGSSGRSPVDYPPYMATNAFYHFTTEAETLHMFFIVQLSGRGEVTLFIRHGEDGVQIFEDSRMNAYLTRREPSPRSSRTVRQSRDWRFWRGWGLW